MKIEWSRRARADLLKIVEFISQDSPAAAYAVYEAVQDQTRKLADAPAIGRPGRLEGTRELVIRRTPYIAVYRLARERVRILRVLHGAQLWPPAKSRSETN